MPITVIPAPSGGNAFGEFLSAFMQSRRDKQQRDRQSMLDERAAEQEAHQRNAEASGFLKSVYDNPDTEKMSQFLAVPQNRAAISATWPAINVDKQFPLMIDNITGQPYVDIRKPTAQERLATEGTRASIANTEAQTAETRVRTITLENSGAADIVGQIKGIVNDPDARPLYNGKPMGFGEVGRLLNSTRNAAGDPLEGAKRAGFDPDKITYSPKLENNMRDLEASLRASGDDPVEAHVTARGLLIEDPTALSKATVEDAQLLAELRRMSLEAGKRSAADQTSSLAEARLGNAFLEDLRMKYESAKREVWGGIAQSIRAFGYKTNERGEIVPVERKWVARKFGAKPYLPSEPNADTEGEVFTLNEIAALFEPYSPAGQKWLAEHKLPIPDDPEDITHIRATLRAIEGVHGHTFEMITLPGTERKANGTYIEREFKSRDAFLAWALPLRQTLSQRGLAVDRMKKGGITMERSQSNLLQTDAQGNLVLTPEGKPQYDPARVPPMTPRDISGGSALAPAAPDTPATPGAPAKTPAAVPGMTPEMQQMSDSIMYLFENTGESSQALNDRLDVLTGKKRAPAPQPTPTPAP